MAVHTAFVANRCAVKPPIISPLAATLVAIAVGAIVWLPLNALNQAFGNAPNDAWSIWNWTAYPLLLLLAGSLGYLVSGSGSLYGLFAIFSSYCAALFLVPQTRNLLPFELLWIAFLSVPAVLLGRFGARMRQRKLEQAAVDNVP